MLNFQMYFNSKKKSGKKIGKSNHIFCQFLKRDGCLRLWTLTTWNQLKKKKKNHLNYYKINSF